MADATNTLNTIVRFEFKRGTNQLGSADVELFDQDKPETVRNFLLYARSGAYSNLFLHRAVSGFVVQGGGFTVTNPTSSSTFSSYNTISNFGRVPNEFLTGARMSNILGTIAMAKVANDPNSATGEWFFNMADNSANLDSQNGGFTVFGRMLETTNAINGTNILTHFNSLSTSAGIINLSSLLGTNYQVFNSLPVAYTNTVTRVPFYRELYYVQISVLNDPISPGSLPPTVSLTAPAPFSLFTNQLVRVAGTSEDDTGVARVLYRLGNGPWNGATGTTNWEAYLDPVPGFNTVTVRSVDWDGQYSSEISANFYYQRTVPLQLEISGNGTVAGVTNGQMLSVGSSYTATASPLNGNIFNGWSGSITSAAATVTFQVQTNATNFNLKAEFMPNPLPSLVGTYNGLFQTLGPLDYDGAGFMSLVLKSSGAIEGSILFHGVTYFYTGQFDSSGNATLGGVMDGVNRTISLTLQRANPLGLITGTFSGTSSTTLIQLERLDSALQPTNSPPAGNYTFVLPALTNAPNPVIPGGSGYGTGTLSSGGTFTLAGTLGDGAAFTASPKVTKFGRWPLYVPLDSGKGALWGWITYNTNQSNQVQSSLSWIRTPNGAAATYPSGFSNQVPFIAARYTPPASGERVLNWVYGQVRLTGTDLSPGLTNTTKLTTNNAFQFLSPNIGQVQLNLEPASGLINGSFIHPWFGTSNVIRGALLGTSNYIRGQYAQGSQISSFAVDVSSLMATQTVASATLPALLAAMNEGGTIQFASGGVIVLSNALVPKFNTRLEANGNAVTISGAGTTRLVEVPTNVNFSASGITFADGFHRGTNGTTGAVPSSGSLGFGGGILNQGGTVLLTNCIVTNCVALGGNAGMDTSTNGLPTTGGRALGGAICGLGGSITLENSTLVNNLALGGTNRSHAASGRIADAAASALGAGVFVEGSLCTIRSSSFINNQSIGGSPLPVNSSTNARAGQAAGGAIALINGSIQMTNSHLAMNLATGPAASTNAGYGGGFGGGLFLETNAVAAIQRTHFLSNSATAGTFTQTAEAAEAKGGAIYNAGSLNIRDCSFEENSADAGSSIPTGDAFGGALFSAGVLVASGSTFSDNRAVGGEYRNLPATAVHGGDAAGGALFTLANSFITNSTFAHNHALGGSGADPAGQTNAARGSATGGAVAVVSNTTLLVNVTLAYNEAAAGTGGVLGSGEATGGGLARQGGTLNLRNTLVASNTPANFFGAITDSGYNLSSDASVALTSSGSRTNTDPVLVGLSTNGGPTLTMAILSQSPARDAVPANYPAVDQRGTPRPQGSFADIGAFEFVQTLPVFGVQPSGTNVVRLGTNITYQAVASGPAPIGYFWLKDANPITGATNSTLSLTNIQESAAGLYSAVATNSYGATTSSVVTLIVNLQPVITVQPLDLVISPGANTSLVVTVLGPALNYRWLRNQVLLPGETNAAFAIPNAGPGADGSYQVIITNSIGAVTSRVASVTWSSAALAILAQPQSRTATVGSSSTFTVLASGVSPITYQWYRNNSLLPGATNGSFTLSSVATTNAGNYSVIVANPFLALSTTNAVLTVITPPTLTIRNPDPATILITCFGDSGRVYHLQTMTNLTTNGIWSTLTSGVMPGGGSITWSLPLSTNTEPLFFRAVTP